MEPILKSAMQNQISNLNLKINFKNFMDKKLNVFLFFFEAQDVKPICLSAAVIREKRDILKFILIFHFNYFCN